LKSTKNPCACGSGRDYQQCCGLLHAGTPAANAPDLMRSRYTAYVLANEPYLLATWHSSTRPRSIAFDQQQRWLGLKVLDSKVTGEWTAEVEFIARYRIGGFPATRLHERGRFVHEAGRWFYVDGDIVE
jgi:SEC-C motif-containing protein